MHRDYWFIGLSLSNLAFLWVWQMNKAITRGDSYFLRVGTQDYIAFMINVCVFGLLLVGMAVWLKRIDRRGVTVMGQVLFLLATLFFLNHIRLMRKLIRDSSELYAQSVVGTSVFSGPFQIVLVSIVAAVVVVAVYKHLSRIAKVARIAVMLLFPWAVITVVGSLWFVIRYDPEALFADSPTGRMPEDSMDSGNRVVLLLFDELDQAFALETRPDDVSLPELDRFRSQALEATRFYPNGGYTRLAVPGLLTGKQVVESRPSGPSELTIRYEGEDQDRDWASQTNLFQSAAQLGASTAVSGWYHPYCRLFAEHLTRCFWMPIWWTSRDQDTALMQGVLNQWRYLIPGIGIAWQRTVSYKEIKRHAEQMVADDDLEFVFVHYPIPHRPIIYDRHKGRMTTSPPVTADYYDNLTLVDVTLGELRQELESHGLWDETAVIITSDHGVWDENYGLPEAPLIRNAIGIRKIPFLVKLPAQQTSASIDDSLHARVTHDFVLSILEGRVSDVSEARIWLEGAARNLEARP